MKVAIVHDYIKEYGGAERVLEKLVELFPEAPIYTLVYCPEFLGPHRKRFGKFIIKPSFLQYFPFKEKFISLFRVVSPFLFKQFDFSEFDVIIVSQTGAYFPNLINKKNKKIICYTHTPPRYLYGYKTAREWKNNPLFLVLGEITNHFLRLVDYKASKNVDYFIANSQEVASRIKKFYRRDAVVIYPPVETENSKRKTQSAKLQRKAQNEYYLTGGRLARAKGIDIVVDAFIKLGKPLKIFGRGFAGFEQELKSQITHHKSLITFLGEVTDEEKFELMRNAKAFIFASFDEDFGITPVEAMSVGTPVIAYNSGGVKETVIDPSSPSTSSGSSGQEGTTGLLYELNDSNHLTEAIKKFERTFVPAGRVKINPEDCIKQAQKFSEERFKKKIIEFVKGLTLCKVRP